MADDDLGLDGGGHVDDEHLGLGGGRAGRAGIGRGVGLPGAEVLLGEGEAFRGGDVAGDGDPGAVGCVVGLVEGHDVVALDVAQSDGRAVAGVGVGVGADDGAGGDEGGEVFGAGVGDGEAGLGLAHLAIDFFLGEGGVARDVAHEFHAEGGVALHEGHGDAGDVVAGGGGEVAAGVIDGLGELLGGARGGAFAEQAGGHGGEAGFLGGDVGVAGEDLEGGGDERQAVILDDVDAEAVGESLRGGLGEFEGPRGGGAGRSLLGGAVWAARAVAGRSDGGDEGECAHGCLLLTPSSLLRLGCGLDPDLGLFVLGEVLLDDALDVGGGDLAVVFELGVVELGVVEEDGAAAEEIGLAWTPSRPRMKPAMVWFLALVSSSSVTGFSAISLNVNSRQVATSLMFLPWLTMAKPKKTEGPSRKRV